MRKLTVKNFSVIKEAELEFGKITVLIGPQSSGKSLLCKLAYFFSKEVLDIAVGRALNEFEFSKFEEDVSNRFFEWFPMRGLGEDYWSISYVADKYEVSVSGITGGVRPLVFDLNFSADFRIGYIKQLSIARPWAKGIVYSAFSKLMGVGIWEGASYIPSERSYFVDTQKGYRLLASQSDPIASRFAEFYANSLNPDIPKRRLGEHLHGELIRGGDSWLFSFADGRVLPLNYLSTGSKELLPLLCGLENYVNMRRQVVLDEENGPIPEDSTRFDNFFIEEPEAHIFPQKQYEIVQYFVEIMNDKMLRSTISITTHSPYILSAFNNLIYAGQLGKDKVISRKIPIDKKYWIEPGTFAAYSIHDGKLESILSESGLIDGEYLDNVSEKIGREFDSLLRLEYAKTKAS